MMVHLHAEPDLPDAYDPARGRAIRWAMMTAAGLALMKLVVGIGTHSLVILASAVDSLLDFVVSTLNALSLRAASAPADEDHPYGHGKIENLAGLFQSLFIAGSAGFLLWQAVARLIRAEPLRGLGWGFGTMAVSLVVTGLLIHRLRRTARQTGSMILETEILHYTTDVAANLGVIATLGLVWATGLSLFDPLVAFSIAVYILIGAGKIFLRAIRELLDTRAEPSLETRVKSLIQSHHLEIVAFHDFKTRRSGREIYLEFHLVFKGNPPFRQVHDITERLIAKVKSQVPHAHVMVHMDPEEGP